MSAFSNIYFLLIWSEGKSLQTNQNSEVPSVRKKINIVEKYDFQTSSKLLNSHSEDNTWKMSNVERRPQQTNPRSHVAGGSVVLFSASAGVRNMRCGVCLEAISLKAPSKGSIGLSSKRLAVYFFMIIIICIIIYYYNILLYISSEEASSRAKFKRDDMS